MQLTVVSDGCTDATNDMTGRGYVQMGTRHFRVHSIRAENVGVTPQHVTLRVPARQVWAARAYARRHHRRYAYLRLFVHTAEHGTGRYPQTYETRNRVRPS